MNFDTDTIPIRYFSLKISDFRYRYDSIEDLWVEVVWVVRVDEVVRMVRVVEVIRLVEVVMVVRSHAGHKV